MFWSFEFWSFDIVSNFVLRYSNLDAVEKHYVYHLLGPLQKTPALLVVMTLLFKKLAWDHK
jgi:hypothetical protein